MASVIGQSFQRAELTAVIYPPCRCGSPFAAHLPSHGACTGYDPQRPIRSLGVVAYTHRSRWCRWLFSIEARVRALRVAHEHRFSHSQE